MMKLRSALKQSIYFIMMKLRSTLKQSVCFYMYWKASSRLNAAPSFCSQQKFITNLQETGQMPAVPLHFSCRRRHAPALC